MIEKHQNPPLTKPKFIKVIDLQQGRSGYNIYVKVIQSKQRQIDTRDGQKITMIDAVVADQTGAARAFFKGQHAKGIKEGATIAIRNGVKRIIKERILLQLNLFGRVTQENINIKPNTQKNISDQQIIFQSKQYYRKDGTRRQFNNRNQDRRATTRRFQGRRGDRRNDRRDNRMDDRRIDRDQYRKDYKKDYRKDDKGDYRNYYKKDERRDRDYDRDKDKDYDRRQNKQDYHDRQRDRSDKLKTGYQEKRGQRKPMLKINQIQAGSMNLRFIAKVQSAEVVKGSMRTSIRCILGDQTGIVNAFLPESNLLVTGATVALFNVEAAVVKQHIEIQNGRVETARNPITKVNEQFNLSEKSWVKVD